MYFFRNLNIDKESFKREVSGTMDSCFNIRFIKTAFDEVCRSGQDKYDADEFDDIIISYTKHNDCSYK